MLGVPLSETRRSRTGRPALVNNEVVLQREAESRDCVHVITTSRLLPPLSASSFSGLVAQRRLPGLLRARGPKGSG